MAKANRLRVLIDSNVYLSSLLFGGVPLQAVQIATLHSEIYGFSYIAEELYRVLTSPKFKWKEKEARWAIEIMLASMQLVDPDKVIALTRDAKDDPILACARTANVHYLITGDKDLLSLASYDKISIITPRQFVALTTNG